MWWEPPPCIFDVLDGGTDFYSSSRDGKLVLKYYVPWKKQLWRLPLAFLTKGALSPRSRNHCENCQLLSISIPVIHSGTREIATGWVRTHWMYYKSGIRQNYKLPDLSKPPTLTRGHNVFFGSPRINVNSEPISSRSRKVWLFPVPQCTVTLVKSCRFP